MKREGRKEQNKMPTSYYYTFIQWNTRQPLKQDKYICFNMEIFLTYNYMQEDLQKGI